MKKPSGMDHMTMYSNQFFATPEGQELINSIFDKKSDIYKQIQRQVEVHNSIMDKLKNVALGNEEGVVPGYMSMPRQQPVQQPQQQMQPGFPNVPLIPPKTL